MLRIPIYCLLLLLSGCKAISEKIKPVEHRRANVVLILADDLAYADLGIYGSGNIHTPHLDALAEEGVLLSSFYVAQSVCSASRAAILTGCYPNRIGIHNALMPQSEVGLNPAETTLAEMLKPQGYRSALFGKWHLGDAPGFLPLSHGFDEFYGIPYSNDMWPQHPLQGTVFDFDPLPLYENDSLVSTLTEQSSFTAELTARSIDFIDRNRDQPFFLYLAHPQPHVPLQVSGRFRGKSDRGLYGDVIMELDWSVGEILQALRRNGLESNTIVIFTSDNGPWLEYGNHAGSALPYREGKGTSWEGGHRVPFIMRYPDKLVGGTTLNTPVMAIDLLPTIAELTASSLPSHPIDGKSAWKVLSGQSTEPPQQAYFFYGGRNELQGVRYGKWKLYFPHSYRSMDGQLPGRDGKPGEYRQIQLKDIHLFDVVSDPSESRDLAAEYPEVVQEIKVLADGIRARLGDSLQGMEGKEQRPAGHPVIRE